MAVTDPFRGLIDGVLQGHAIATQLRNQAMQEEAFQRSKVRQDQEGQLQDMEAQQRIGSAGRAVTGNMVAQSFDAPPGADAIPGIDQAPRTVSYSRPVDKARLLTYKTRDGRTLQAEAYTPEERLAQTLGDRSQTITAGAMAQADAGQKVRQQMLNMPGAATTLPDSLADALGYGRGSTVLRNELPDLLLKAAKLRKSGFEKVAANETLLDTSGATDTAGSSGDFGGEVSDNTAASGQAPGARIIGRGVDRAGADRASREKIAADNRAAANTRATNRNATSIQAAGIRRDMPTANSVLEGRFEQKRRDAAQKSMQAVQGKEDEEHAVRIGLGQQLSDPKMTDDRRQQIQAALKSSTFKIQAYQMRKAAIGGAQVPPKAIQDKIPEGHQMPTPDGHVWQKQGGIVYFVK